VGPAAQPPQRRPGLRRVARLAEDPVVERDDRVDAEDDRPGARDRPRLAQRVELGDRARLAGGVLLDVRRLDRELDAELLEDRPPLRRAAREDYRLGKNRATSRSADSSESDPWTMF
jgi:hypothetical protein